MGEPRGVEPAAAEPCGVERALGEAPRVVGEDVLEPGPARARGGPPAPQHPPGERAAERRGVEREHLGRAAGRERPGPGPRRAMPGGRARRDHLGRAVERPAREPVRQRARRRLDQREERAGGRVLVLAGHGLVGEPASVMGHEVGPAARCRVPGVVHEARIHRGEVDQAAVRRCETRQPRAQPERTGVVVEAVAVPPVGHRVARVLPQAACTGHPCEVVERRPHGPDEARRGASRSPAQIAAGRLAPMPLRHAETITGPAH